VKKAKANLRAKPKPKTKSKTNGKTVGGLVKFKKGERPVGRQKGTKNKITVKLKEAILEAAERSGSNGKGKDGTVGYLMWLSRAEPAVYGRMLEKILPLQLDVRDKTNEKLTPAQAIERLRERGLPVPSSLTDLAAKVGEAVSRQQENDDDAEMDGGDDLDHLENDEQEPDEEAA